jgi:predicted ATPase
MKTLIDTTEIPNLEEKGFKLWEQQLDSYEKAQEFCGRNSNGRDFVISPIAVIKYDVYFKSVENKQ